jgi:hypothetical protein
MGWIVFGTLCAVLAAEMYVLFNHEEKISIDEQENECACKCNCCHCNKEEEDEEE